MCDCESEIAHGSGSECRWCMDSRRLLEIDAQAFFVVSCVRDISHILNSVQMDEEKKDDIIKDKNRITNNFKHLMKERKLITRK